MVAKIVPEKAIEGIKKHLEETKRLRNILIPTLLYLLLIKHPSKQFLI